MSTTTENKEASKFANLLGPTIPAEDRDAKYDASIIQDLIDTLQENRSKWLKKSKYNVEPVTTGIEVGWVLEEAVAVA